MIDKVVPSFARKLKNRKLVPVDHSELVEEMHKAGINVRFLGCIRSRIDASLSHLRSFLLTEICARVMKQKIRHIMRKACISPSNPPAPPSSSTRAGKKYADAASVTMKNYLSSSATSPNSPQTPHPKRTYSTGDTGTPAPQGHDGGASKHRSPPTSTSTTRGRGQHRNARVGGHDAADGYQCGDDGAWDQAGLHQQLVDYFNKCLGNSAASRDYWQKKLKLLIQFKFINALSDDEARVDFDLRDVVLKFPLFMRLQETTGVIFKTSVQTRLFEHPYLFDNPDPFKADDLAVLRARTKNIFVRTGELKSSLRRALTLEREKDSEQALSANFDARDDIMVAYSTLINLYHHKQITEYIGEDAPEAIQSFYRLAQCYKQMGNTDKALHYALKSLYYGEVLFGPYSEETIQGLRTVGEIFEAAHKSEETVEFYNRALQAVEKMYFLHPAAGKLHVKLCFLQLHHNPAEAQRHLQLAYAAYGGIYGYEKARLVVPLLALKNNVQAVTKKMDETLSMAARDTSLMQMAHLFWPEEFSEAVSSTLTTKDGKVNEVLTKLDLEEHILSFQYHEVDDEVFLSLTKEDLFEIGIKDEESQQLLLKEIDNLLQMMEEDEMDEMDDVMEDQEGGDGLSVIDEYKLDQGEFTTADVTEADIDDAEELAFY